MRCIERKELSMADSSYVTFQRMFILIDEHDTRRKPTVMADTLLDFSNNNFESLDRFLEWGKRYRITIEEVQDASAGTEG